MIWVEFEVLVVRSDLVAIARPNDAGRAGSYQVLNFMRLCDINTTGVEGNLEWEEQSPQFNIVHCWNSLWMLLWAGLQSLEEKKKNAEVNIKTPLFGLPIREAGAGWTNAKRVLAHLWSEPPAWGQLRGQASPSSAKSQDQGSPIHQLILEMLKKAKKRSGAA